jgi:hypothetical protein
MNQKNSFYKNTLQTAKSRVAKRVNAAISQLHFDEFADVVPCCELALHPLGSPKVLCRSG